MGARTRGGLRGVQCCESAQWELERRDVHRSRLDRTVADTSIVHMLLSQGDGRGREGREAWSEGTLRKGREDGAKRPESEKINLEPGGRRGLEAKCGRRFSSETRRCGAGPLEERKRAHGKLHNLT